MRRRPHAIILVYLAVTDYGKVLSRKKKGGGKLICPAKQGYALINFTLFFDFRKKLYLTIAFYMSSEYNNIDVVLDCVGCEIIR